VSAAGERLTKAGQRFVDDMIRCRGMDWVRLGMMVEVDGHLGTIKGMNSSANLDVEFVNQLKWGKGTHNCHPTWETRYFDADGILIRDYTKKGQKAAQLLADARVVQQADQRAFDAELASAPAAAFAGLPESRVCLNCAGQGWEPSIGGERRPCGFCNRGGTV